MGWVGFVFLWLPILFFIYLSYQFQFPLQIYTFHQAGRVSVYCRILLWEAGL